MSKTINILSVIDVETIIENNIPAGTLTSPTPLGSYTDSDNYVYMITNKGYIDSTDTTRAASELKIDANVGDTIQWELTCPGSGLQHNAIIANVLIGSQPTPNSITAPVSIVTNRHIFDTAGIPAYQVVQQTDFTSSVLTSGVTQYTITFQIMDNLGNNLGYYYWDPFVSALATADYLKERAVYLEKEMVK
jgi:hypothetical protein